MTKDKMDDRSGNASSAFTKARHPRPVSKLERDSILDSIAEPEIVLENTPEGTVVKQVNQELDDDQRERLKAIDERLRAARKEKAIKRGFDKNRSR